MNCLLEDLIEAQSKRSEMQSIFSALQSEVDGFRSQFRIGEKHLNDLHLEKSALLIKLKDRDEELKGKTKLLEVKHRVNGHTLTYVNRTYMMKQ